MALKQTMLVERKDREGTIDGFAAGTRVVMILPARIVTSSGGHDTTQCA